MYISLCFEAICIGMYESKVRHGPQHNID